MRRSQTAVKADPDHFRHFGIQNHGDTRWRTTRFFLKPNLFSRVEFEVAAIVLVLKKEIPPHGDASFRNTG